MEQRVVATAMQSSHHQRCFDNSIVVVAVFFFCLKNILYNLKKKTKLLINFSRGNMGSSCVSASHIAPLCFAKHDRFIQL